MVMTAVALYEVREESFVVGGDSVSERILDCFARCEIDAVVFGESPQITPGTSVTFDKLTDELPDAGFTLRDDTFCVAVLDFNWLVQLTLQRRP